MSNRMRFRQPGPLGLTHDDHLLHRPLSLTLQAYNMPHNRPLVVNDNRILLAGPYVHVNKLKKYKDQAQKIYDYYKRAQKLIDPETRPKALFDELFNLAMDKLTNIFGKGIKHHPFFKYHETHFEVLRKALDAVGTLETAERALEAARETVVEMNKESFSIIKEGKKTPEKGPYAHTKYDRMKIIRLAIHNKVLRKSYEVLGSEVDEFGKVHHVSWRDYLEDLKKDIVTHDISREDLQDEIDYLQSEIIPILMNQIRAECNEAEEIALGLTARYGVLSAYHMVVERYLDLYEKKLKELEKSSAIGKIMADNERKKRFKKLRPEADQIRENAKNALYGKREVDRWVRFAARCRSGNILLYDKRGKKILQWPWETARYHPPEDD